MIHDWLNAANLTKNEPIELFLLLLLVALDLNFLYMMGQRLK